MPTKDRSEIGGLFLGSTGEKLTDISDTDIVTESEDTNISKLKELKELADRYAAWNEMDDRLEIRGELEKLPNNETKEVFNNLRHRPIIYHGKVIGEVTSIDPFRNEWVGHILPVYKNHVEWSSDNIPVSVEIDDE